MVSGQDQHIFLLGYEKERNAKVGAAALGPLARIIAECRGTPRKYM
jgi:hypothetical protein